LIAGLSSGKIVVLRFEHETNQWDQTEIDAHDSSVNAVAIFKPNKVDQLIDDK
jgi:hypothetical protein